LYNDGNETAHEGDDDSQVGELVRQRENNFTINIDPTEVVLPHQEPLQ